MAGTEQPMVPGVITPHYIRTGLYYLSGGGGNSVLRLSGVGLLLVDGKTAGNYDELRLRLKKISNQVIRVVINTSHYQDHTGTNAKFLADKAPVLGQQNEKQILASYTSSGEIIAPPSNTYDHDQTLHLGLVEAQLLHLGNARTSADTVVYFADEKTVALGDIFSAAPNPDYSAGGSLVGWGPVLGEVLKLDFNVAVPGNGPLVPRSAVEALKTKIDTLVSRATQLVKNGATKDQLMTQLKTDDLGWSLSFSPEQVSGFYAELSRTK
jgi:glyoxylase-like metal-dependent hydrolase (beta-lactamase superfamily II)